MSLSAEPLSTTTLRSRQAGRWNVVIAAALLAAIFVASLCWGRVAISPTQVGRALTGNGASANLTILIREIRLPRALMAVAVGAALAVAGLLMQTVTRNPMATPSVLGISNGAQLGMLLALIFAPGASEIWPAVAAFAGALVSSVAIGVMTLAGPARQDRNYLIVGGNLMGALLGATTMAVIFLSHMNGALSDWVVGALLKVTWARVAIAGPILVAGLIIAGAIVARVDALQLGRDIATGLGVHTQAYTIAALSAVVLLTGSSVAVAGPVAYIGLVVPHLISRRRNSHPAARLLACALAGGALAAVADLLARTLPFPRVVPMGIWTMSLGAIFFVALSMRSRPAAGRAN